MKPLKRIFISLSFCLLLLTTLAFFKAASAYSAKNDKCMDWLEYVIVLRFDKQADYLYSLSNMLKDPSAPLNEISSFVDGANVLAQQDDLMDGAYHIVFDGKTPNYIITMKQTLNVDKSKLLTLSTEEREAYAAVFLELASLYDRHNAENSISWYLFKKDYTNPALLSLEDRAAQLAEQICS